jgi:hypothetical protein
MTNRKAQKPEDKPLSRERKALTARELIAALEALPEAAKDMPVMVDYNCSAGRTPVYSVFGDGDEAYPYVMLSGE